MSEATGRVEGSNSEHTCRFFGLSTCIWCKKTRQFLEDNDVAFDFTYVDLLQGEERARAIEEVKKWNPGVNFPTVVIDDEPVVGFEPDTIKEKLGL
ncbi:MAG: glutaredoxin family protein [Candidatus Eisenbacteria bacterium]|nr:glutaredoxin family protein [Candidatus Eisenbacteria bacterium]